MNDEYRSRILGEFPETLKIKLEPSETYCNRCNGTRTYDKTPSEKGIDKRSCPKCHGTGKLDWVEQICGKKPLVLKEKVTILPYKMGKKTFGVAIEQELVRDLTKQLAEEIDNEIMEGIIENQLRVRYPSKM